MKRKQLKKGLTIKKETVANLDESQLKHVKGGYPVPIPTYYCTGVCTNWCHW